MNNVTNYQLINNSILFYSPYFLIYLKELNKEQTIIESIFYFIFVFDKEYSNFMNDTRIRSKISVKLTEYSYFKYKDKNNFISPYYYHFMKIISLCLNENYIEIDNGNLKITNKGTEKALYYMKKIRMFPRDSVCVLFLNKTIKISRLARKEEFIDLLEKIGVKSL